MRDVKVDHKSDVIDVDTSCHDICSHQDIHFPVLELSHHLFPLGLFQIRVHLGHIEFHLAQGFRQLLYFHFGGGEDDYPLRTALAEQVFQNP